MDTEIKNKSIITEILPNTKRTQERRQKQMEDEMKKKKELENQMKAQEEQQKQIKQLLLEKEMQKKMEDDRRKQEEQKNQEEQEQIKNLKGEFGYMIKELEQNQSKLNYTITGFDLKEAQISLLVNKAETNTSLKGLAMCRKRISDELGLDLVRRLESNGVLERLELEGNLLGPKTAAQVGQLLEKNRALRYLDLENNNLTNWQKDVQGQDNSGILALVKSLKLNDVILQLNLCNCKLDAICGKALAEAMEVNETLISVDIEENPNMDLNDVRRIQDCLKRNKRAYDDERHREFMERGRLGKEEQIATVQLIKGEENELANDGIEDRIKARREELERQWKEDIDKEIKLKEKIVHNLQKQAKLAGKKKGGAKPKKK